MLTTTIVCRSRLTLALTLLGGVLAVLPGCGSSSAATDMATSPEQAQAVLRQALDAWKSGAAHDALANQSPAIRVADEQWLAGEKLVDYTLQSPGTAVGPQVPCPVVLTVKTARGRTVKQTVLYQVSLEPTPMIVRQD